jgi:hypothetical protein
MSHRTNPHKKPGAASNLSTSRAKAAGERRAPDAKPNANQGEGNVTAARRYNEDQREFVQSGRVEDAARGAAPRNPDESRSMADAEREGRSHAREEDPSVPRDYRR